MTEPPRSALCQPLVAAGIAVILATACSATGSSQQLAGQRPVTADSVLYESPLAAGVSPDDIAPGDILAVSPEMAAFLDANVDRGANQNVKLAELLRAIIGGDRFRLSYEDSTRTATGTFNARRGNCVSFTNMFIAMARDVGLRASYQEVEIPPDWSMTGESYLLSQHVNALVDMKNALSRVVDFNTVDYRSEDDMRVISDARGRAHYYNNVGVERMLADHTTAAYANLRQSLVEDVTFSSAWVNMGILHRREGYPALAEAALLRALDLNGADLMAMSNLASLYEEEGRTEQARLYLNRVRSHRMKNPYYRYQLANTAFSEGNYKEAISNLRTAIRLRGDDDRFYYLLSLSYLMSGDREQAQQLMKKAEEVAQQTADQEKYHHKLELIRGQRNEF